MKRPTTLSRIGGAAGLAFALACACGGRSFTQNDNGDGGSSNAGNSQGGKNSQAGSHTTAGKAQGGSASAGTGSGGSAAAGASAGFGGGSYDDPCSAPPASGQCLGAFQRWYHDPATGTCQPFIWGGCGGNSNNYESAEACQAACPAPQDVYSCKLPTDCMIGTTSCCGVCDGPGLTTQDFVAYNRQFAGSFGCGFTTNTAPIGGTGAGFPGAGVPVACPPCLAPQPDQETLKYFVPDCVMNRCVVEDLRTSAVTACKTSDECQLRSGNSCCEGCGLGDYVAVRKDGSFEKLVCGGLPVACEACAPQPPSGAVAWCNAAAGHCQVSYAVPAP